MAADINMRANDLHNVEHRAHNSSVYADATILTPELPGLIIHAHSLFSL